MPKPIIQIRDLRGQSSALEERAAQEETPSEVTEVVREIIAAIRDRGDKAVTEFTQKFDRAAIDPSRFEVGKDEIQEAYGQVSPEVMGSLEKAKANIEAFHSRHRRESWLEEFEGGVRMGEQVTPIDRVGVYVPGGLAFYPSSVLMTIVPAKIAGCEEICMVSPPSYKGGTIHPAVLAAADLAGATRIFRVGGAQAVAALAYGTETIPRVDKIVGPGNIYVTIAKRMVTGLVGIDKEAGPSEVIGIADDSARADWIAWDLMSQSEHEEFARAILITDSESLAGEVKKELGKAVSDHPRKEILLKSLGNLGEILLVDSIDRAVEISNQRAPEHLHIVTRDPESLLGQIKHAGAVFLGPFSPVAVGDYIAGPNHVLPTEGQARFASPLSVDDFVKVSSVVIYTEEQLKRDGPDVIRLAELEGLPSHAESIRARLRSNDR